MQKKLAILLAGIVLAVLLAGCMLMIFGAAGIAGSGGAPPPAPESAPVTVENQEIVLEVPLPRSPATVPQYRVVSFDRYSGGTSTALSIKKEIPSIEKAPGLAEKALTAYGGLPSDAVREKTEQVFLNQYNLKTGTTEERFPQYTLIRYRQYVNGTPIVNTGLSVELGEAGELAGLSGHWATLEQTGETPIIPADVALQKLKDGDLLLRPQCCIDDSHIIRVMRGYYIREGTREPQPPARVITPDTCIPVWAFYAVKPGAETEPFPLLVDATER